MFHLRKDKKYVCLLEREDAKVKHTEESMKLLKILSMLSTNQNQAGIILPGYRLL